MAQLMEEEAGPANFEVLEALDTDEVNENHSGRSAGSGPGGGRTPARHRP
jgi:hypothetical protein